MLNRHDQSPSARQRIPVNRKQKGHRDIPRALWLVIIAIELMIFAAPALHARQGLAYSVNLPVVVPFYGAEGYAPALRLVNPTSETHVVPPPCVAPCRAVPVGPFETKVLTSADGFLGSGGGMQELTIPSALRAYVEVTDPAGTRIRISPLAALEDATQVQDIGVNGYLWVGSFGYAYLSVEWFRNAESLGAPVHVDLNGWLSTFGHVDLLAAPPGANRAVIQRRLIPRQQAFFVFGYDKSPNGEIDSVSYATPLP